MQPDERAEPQDPNDQARRRRLMVERQLRQRGVTDERVLAAMETVPREQFVPADQRPYAYDDGPLAIGLGQTISQPLTVALMAEAARIAPADNVLEIGTGSGYGAAILGHLAATVHTVERHEQLAEIAQQRLAQLGLAHVRVHVGDGSQGWGAAAPYDAIVVTAGAADLPRPLVEQLAEGGRIIIPIGPSPRSQWLRRFTRHGDRIDDENLGRFAFVPLIGQHGWPEETR
jgi:protein-L-isoaspartate(D-aspartate) O-methyltransferase